jgi:hypothetical protein
VYMNVYESTRKMLWRVAETWAKRYALSSPGRETAAQVGGTTLLHCGISIRLDCAYAV